MNLMLKILEDLTSLSRVFCSSDYDKAIAYLEKILPFEVLRYTSRNEYNGWIIPPKWDVKEAKIVQNGKVIYDGLKHPLCVIALSKSFRGKVTLEELRRHLHFDHRRRDSIPYHFRQMYRSWDRDWGFCVTRDFFDQLEPGTYEVVLETKESEGVLKILDHTHPGALAETFVFVGHLDHPGMANDDLAGCAVGVELFRRLSQRQTKYSYKLLLLQEIIGSEYYLGRPNGRSRNQLFEAMMLEMLGTETQLALQKSLHAESNLEWAVEKSLADLQVTYRTGPFGSIVTNDEHIWETYGIPMASLSRFPYPEYHSHHDNVPLISERALRESLEVLLRAIDFLESSELVFKKFQGNLCLSNPKYNLYVDPGEPAFGTLASNEIQKMRLLMDLIPKLHRPTTMHSLCERVGIDENCVRQYLQRWVEKGLLELR